MNEEINAWAKLDSKHSSNSTQINSLPRKILNRRYRKLSELIEEGEYFSEEQIKLRHPALHYLYIGRYLREGGEVPTSFYQLLMTQQSNQEGLERIQDIVNKYPSLYEDLKEVERELSGKELEDSEDELIVLMHHRFLAGLDHHFINYNDIDQNE